MEIAPTPQASFALTNGKVVLPDRVATDAAVVIRRSIASGSITAILDGDSIPAEIDRIDVGRRWITPGLIDIHTHGALGHTFNEADEEAFNVILRENAQRGVTGLLATMAVAPLDDLLHLLEFVRQWMAVPRPGAQVLGAHLEGPYIHPAQCGALDPGCLRSPRDGSASQLMKFADVLRILVLAPELPGARELVAQLAECGILPAAGHCTAKEEDVLAAMQAGLQHVTHLFSAMSATVREGPWRKPGLLETALVHPGLSVEMIADNKHLPPTLMKLAYKCIGPDRLCVVSDATSGAGLPEGSRFRMGQMEYEVADGVGMMLDRTSFAGSTTLLNQMIPVLTDVVGIPLPEAIRMVSLNPARVLHLEKQKGSLEVGKDADLAIFNPDFSAWRTMIAGQWVL
ncbi:MAG: N-acetylglucosamine-6-phosphate deacetylase [Anaerolineales bacterium]|nr:N-acetylglucosamine-6-phosphate deacetylase [Anaerolineales bacterium]